MCRPIQETQHRSIVLYMTLGLGNVLFHFLVRKWLLQIPLLVQWAQKGESKGLSTAVLVSGPAILAPLPAGHELKCLGRLAA